MCIRDRKSAVSKLVVGLVEQGYLMAGKRSARSLVPTNGGEFERGRAVGYVAGFRDACSLAKTKIDEVSKIVSRADASSPERSRESRSVERSPRSRPAILSHSEVSQ